jgi:hypothetical protein
MDSQVISTIVVGMLSLAGTLVGSYLTGNKTIALLEFRLKILEEKVDKHNRVIERTYELEKKTSIHDEQIKDIQKDMVK